MRPALHQRPLRLARLALLLSAFLLLRGSSCLQLKRPYPAPTAEALMASLQARARAVTSMRGEARMTHTSPQQQLKATLRMMARRPADLRFDLVSPFDTPIATLVCQGARFALVDAQKGRHYHGPASPCNIARLLNVQLPPQEVLTILAGSTPLIDHDERSVTWDSRAGVEQLRLIGSKLEQIIRLDGTSQRWDVQTVEIRTRQGEVILRTRATDHRRVDGVVLPRLILLEQPARKTAVELRFRSEEVNVELPAVAFELPPPTAGAPSERVDCRAD